MALRRSVLDRSDLYWPAPKISGQASYGGIPVEVYILSSLVFVIMFGVTMVLMGMIKILTSTTISWMFLVPFISTAFYVMFLLDATSKRRDIIVVLRESRRFEKQENKKRNS